MSEKCDVYGLRLQVQYIAGRSDPLLIVVSCQWVGEVLGETWGDGEDMAAVLKDGTVLCRLMNCIKPNSVKKYKETVGVHQYTVGGSVS